MLRRTIGVGHKVSREPSLTWKALAIPDVILRSFFFFHTPIGLRCAACSQTSLASVWEFVRGGEIQPQGGTCFRESRFVLNTFCERMRLLLTGNWTGMRLVISPRVLVGFNECRFLLRFIACSGCFEFTMLSTWRYNLSFSALTLCVNYFVDNLTNLYWYM